MIDTSLLSGAVKSALNTVSSAAKARLAGGGVDIYLRERKGSREIRIPWLPERIEYRSGGTVVASYDIMNQGTVAVPTGVGLASVSWSSSFPGAQRTDYAMLRGEWQEPAVYHQILEDWRKNQVPLTLLVTGYPINLDVFLEDYNATPAGGFGDLEYDISLTEEVTITISSTTEAAAGSASSQDQQTKRAAEETTSYTIKSGDTLWQIAEKHLGSGAKWEAIYEANREILESTAKKYGKSSSDNGWWIYPGVSIKIPTT